MRSKSLRTCAGVGVASVLVLTGVGLAAPASGLYGDAVINPVESNLASKYWTSASATVGGETAALAVDQDPSTAWVGAAGESLTLDLGGAYDNARKIAVEFTDAGAAYRYVIDASSDGVTWSTVADESTAVRASAGAVHLVTSPGMRFVRVTIIEASGDAAIGIRELEVFNYLREDVVLGADMSGVDGDNNQYWVSPLEEDRGAGPHLFDVAKDRGMDFVRLRIWNEPRSESSGQPSAVPRQGPERSLVSAQAVADRDLQLGVDFHYADSWADPGKQPKPRAWAELPFDQLTDSVYDFTYDYVNQLVAQGTPPDKVAVGNEILHGIMWGSEAKLSADASAPVWTGANPAYFRNQADIYQSQPGGGILWQYWNSDDPAERALYLESFDRFTALLGAGIDAVRDASPETSVELHSIVRNEGYDGRSGLDMASEFWNQVLSRLEARDLGPDYIAHSYYPEWHGTPENMERNLQTISAEHPEYKMAIAETSYPASGGNGAPMPNATYPRTVQGQADALQRVFAMVNDIPDNRGAAVLTWEPQFWQSMFRTVPGTNIREPHTSIDVYNKSAARHVLEDRVYVASEVGDVPSLPETVDVLDVASGEVAQTGVTWQSVEAQGAAGRITVAGTTEFGTVEAIIDVVADSTRPEVALISPTTAGPFPTLEVQVDASDAIGVAKIVANIYGKDNKLVKSTQSNVGGASTGTHTASVALPDGSYTVKYNAHDTAGNVSKTSSFAFTIDATKPTATVKNGTNFTVQTGSTYDLISFKLHDDQKIDKVVVNGVEKDLTDNKWSDVNFIKPGVFGAVAGANTLVVHDVAGNTETYTFMLN
jgi:arabinogalactan endo-1,4-beta-galactosidase